MAETGFGYLIAGMGLGMFVLSAIQVVSPGADRRSWVSVLALGFIVLGVWLTS